MWCYIPLSKGYSVTRYLLYPSGEMKDFSRIQVRVLCLLVALGWYATLFSQTLKTDDGVKRWEADFRVGLNNDGYQFDLGIAYFPIQYVGIKAAIGANGEIESVEDWGNDEIYNSHEYATRFKFTPALAIRTPQLIHWKSQDGGFYLFAEPGIILSPGASGSRHPECFNWDFKGGINLQIDRLIFTIGYGITNFCLYSGYPHNSWGLPDNDHYLTHSGFIGAAYKF